MECRINAEFLLCYSIFIYEMKISEKLWSIHAIWTGTVFPHIRFFFIQKRANKKNIALKQPKEP